MTAADALHDAIRSAAREGVQEALAEVRSRRLMSPEDAATYLDLSRREVYDKIARGELPAVRTGTKRGVKLDIRDLDKYIEDSKDKSKGVA